MKSRFINFNFFSKVLFYHKIFMEIGDSRGFTGEFENPKKTVKFQIKKITPLEILRRY